MHTLKYVNVQCVSAARMVVRSDVFKSYFAATMAVI